MDDLVNLDFPDSAVDIVGLNELVESEMNVDVDDLLEEEVTTFGFGDDSKVTEDFLSVDPE